MFLSLLLLLWNEGTNTGWHTSRILVNFVFFGRQLSLDNIGTYSRESIPSIQLVYGSGRIGLILSGEAQKTRKWTRMWASTPTYYHKPKT